MNRQTGALAALLLIAALAQPARATWSIVVVDTRTKEVGIGAATCLTQIGLRRYLAVVRPEMGVAAAQSAIDGGTNRRRIWDELALGTPPAIILQLLDSQDSQHQTRQYGIVDVLGRAVTFTGSEDGAYANGVTGQVGTLVYSIQGNVLTGQPVIDAAQAAFVSTPGGMPERLMAAMEAARSMGGDGRCSCSPGNPTGCGSPPPTFVKSAHVGFIVVSRRGDVEGTCNGSRGCATGTYYMSLNVGNQVASDPDPVLQLRGLFDAFRAGLVGITDAVESEAVVNPPVLLGDGVSTALLTIQLRDYQGVPVSSAPTITVVSSPSGSAASCEVGTLTDRGGGVFDVELRARNCGGLNRLDVQIDDAVGTRFLMPVPTLWVQDARGDLNHDGVVSVADVNTLIARWGGPEGDIDGDGSTGPQDLAFLLSFLGSSSTCP